MYKNETEKNAWNFVLKERERQNQNKSITSISFAF